jgi:hypothetical protein
VFGDSGLELCWYIDQHRQTEFLGLAISSFEASGATTLPLKAFVRLPTTITARRSRWLAKTPFTGSTVLLLREFAILLLPTTLDTARPVSPVTLVGTGLADENSGFDLNGSGPRLVTTIATIHGEYLTI